MNIVMARAGEAVIAHFKVLSHYLYRRTEENCENKSSGLTNIPTIHFTNKSQLDYC
jgi:hypothetical protein